MLAARCDESIGDEHKGPVREGDAFGLAEEFVEDRPQPQLIEHGADGENRPPGGSIEKLGITGLDAVCTGVPAKQSLQLGKDFQEQFFAAQVGDDTLFDLAAFAKRFDDPDVFEDGAVAGADFDDSRIHAENYHDTKLESQGQIPRDFGKSVSNLSLRFFGFCRISA